MDGTGYKLSKEYFATPLQTEKLRMFFGFHVKIVLIEDRPKYNYVYPTGMCTCCVLPTLSMIAIFLREVFHIHFVIKNDDVNKWSIYGHYLNPIKHAICVEKVTGFDTYEKALSYGINEIIKLKETESLLIK